MERKPVLELNTGLISAKTAHGEKPLVRGVSLSLSAGESMALIGETGSGKTMTALSIMRLLPKNVRQTGENVRFCGEPLPWGRNMRELLGTGIAYIPQSGADFLNPSRSVRRQMWDGLQKNGVPLGKRNERTDALLKAVGFEHPEEIRDLYPFALSGGMAQRVSIALAACADAKLVIADEPTNGLDREATGDFFALLKRLFPDAAYLVITHDISVAKHCGRVTVLCRGRMCESGPAETVLSAPNHPYTKALLGALVENGMLETPLLRTDGNGCPFYARCPFAEEPCGKEPFEPSAREQDGTEWWCAV